MEQKYENKTQEEIATGVITLPYKTKIADVLLSGEWELTSVKVDREMSKDCECCGHKHLKFQYRINDMSKKNEDLIVGSECVVKICKDERTVRIMTGLEALRNKLDRVYKQKVLKTQLKEWVEKNLDRLNKLQKAYYDDYIKQGGRSYVASYSYSKWNQGWFERILMRMAYWNSNTSRKVINDHLKDDLKSKIKAPTAKLTEQMKKELDEEKEESMSSFIMGQKQGWKRV